MKQEFPSSKEPVALLEEEKMISFVLGLFLPSASILF